jgi:hypothetical protein
LPVRTVVYIQKQLIKKRIIIESSGDIPLRNKGQPTPRKLLEKLKPESTRLTLLML